jgi:hypothetical protein
MKSFLECTRWWKRERRVQNFLRDTAESYPELEVRVAMKDVKIEKQKITEWKSQNRPFCFFFSFCLGLGVCFQEFVCCEISLIDVRILPFCGNTPLLIVA